jgi:glutamate-1-semialdehyde 2,1-aminomutase
MEISNWSFNETDLKVRRRYLDRIPQKVMDVHVHIYRQGDIGAQGPAYRNGPDDVGIAVYEQNVRKILGDQCALSGIYVAPPTETKEQMQEANAFTIDQLKTKEGAKGLILIAPDMDMGLVHSCLSNEQVIGFKPFCTYGDFKPEHEAPISTFLPEWAWQIANEKSLMMLVHLMTFDALNNPDNYNEINRLCSKYPNARLMLDHTARGFHTYNTVEGLKKIRGLRNVWLDTSSICDPMAFIAVIKGLGKDRLLFGTDFPLCQLRGKSVSVGDGFVWLTNENFKWGSYSNVCNPVLLGIEAVKSVFDAADALDLTAKDIEAIFYGNAQQMTNRQEVPG